MIDTPLSDLQQAVAFRRQVIASNGALKDANAWLWEAAQADAALTVDIGPPRHRDLILLLL
jgi:hypothetical protein